MLSAILACAAIASGLLAPVAQRRPPLKRAPLVRSTPFHLQDLPTLALAESGSASDDPFLIGLAGVSIVLFLFVVGSAGFLTIKEQQTKKDIDAFPDGKPRLPTLAELDEMDGRVAIGGGGPEGEEPAAVNRMDRRQQKKYKKKAPPGLGDASRF
mmetsp:Transcript_24488/g.73492  ORF Transcript_24488/g.73492 Transcript_24488/m.73492 type:complete len:155 (+) Transcript_24488:1103-1567(+)